MDTHERLNASTHFIGTLLSIAGLVLLIVFASMHGTVWHVVGFSIFGASLVLLYSASTMYHFLPSKSKAKNVFQRIDHSMIYVLIAGTYTPICLTILRGGWGWSLFGVVIGLAALGIVIKSVGLRMPPTISTLFYIATGWIIVIAIPKFPLLFSTPGMQWLLAGGILYTIGAVFYALENVPRLDRYRMHEIFHLFVMGGSFSHFWFLFKYVIFV